MPLVGLQLRREVGKGIIEHRLELLPRQPDQLQMVINGLRGVDFPVIQIGATSCGKPYGFFQQDNCGLSYFAIEFEGVNDQGIGGYAHGLAPDCAVGDDFGHALGDPDEARLAAALEYRQLGHCGNTAKAIAPERLKLLRDPSAEVGLRQPPNPS